MITTDEIINLKKPQLNTDILEVFKKRFSPRFFTPEKIKDKEINSIFEAARWTPSAYNNQPWHFYLIETKTKAFKKVLNCLPELNQWAKTAAALAIACYLKDKDDNKAKFAQYDLGASVMSLVIQAQSLGYYARQMALFDKEKLIKEIKINKNHYPFVIVALGKLGDYRKIDQSLLERELRPRERKTDLVKEMKE